jgi:Domain of unknown function (DUF4333)
MASRTARLAAVAALVLAAAACTKSLDSEGLEATLKEQLTQETGSTITAVDCPDEIKVETGGTFECTVTEESGTTFTLSLTQTNDKGNVNYTIKGASPGPVPSGSASPEP